MQRFLACRLLTTTRSISRLRPVRTFSSSGDGGDEEKVSPGIHKSPMTDHLWNLRAKIRQDRKEAEKAAEVDPSEVPLIPQEPTTTSVTYEFSKDHALRDTYLNPWGIIRHGRVLEDLDALAGNVVFKHCSAGRDPEDLLLVTASIDRVVLSHRPNLKDDIALNGKVSWTGSSSAEIYMTATSTWTEKPWLSALFTFVARSKSTGKAIKINPLKIDTPEDQALFDQGANRATTAKRMRKEKDASEMMRLHCDQLLQRPETQEMLFGSSNTDDTITIGQAAQELTSDAKQRLAMPVIGTNGCVRLSDTCLSNTFIMQPQEQNTAGSIFGGFLAKRAFELAFSTAYLFTGVAPKFKEVDKVVFGSPTFVGDLVQFKSSVLYTSTAMGPNPTIHVEVQAIVLSPEMGNTKIANTFNFTFAAPEGTHLNRVLPESHEESVRIMTMYYLDLIQKLQDDEKDASTNSST